MLGFVVEQKQMSSEVRMSPVFNIQFV